MHRIGEGSKIPAASIAKALQMEKFVEIMEESQFDIVGGLVVNKGDRSRTIWEAYDKINIVHSESGNCYEREKHQILTELPGYEGTLF